MGGIWTVLKWGVRNWYDEMLMFVGVGFVASMMLVPFALLTIVLFETLGLPVAALFFIGPFLPGPALVGMHALARELARNEGVSWALFWQKTRQYWWVSTSMFFLSLLATIVLLTSMRFYLSSDNSILQLIGFAWIYGLVLWLIMQIYLLPLLLEQDETRISLRRVYRNAFVIAAAKPLLSLAMLIVSLILLVAGYFTVLGLPVIVVPMIAVLANHALRYAIYGPPKPLT